MRILQREKNANVLTTGAPSKRMTNLLFWPQVSVSLLVYRFIRTQNAVGDDGDATSWLLQNSYPFFYILFHLSLLMLVGDKIGIIFILYMRKQKLIDHDFPIHTVPDVVSATETVSHASCL